MSFRDQRYVSSECSFPGTQIAEEVRKVNGGMRRRTPIACLRRYQATLNTKFIRWTKWTEEEDQTLRAAVEVFTYLTLTLLR